MMCMMGGLPLVEMAEKEDFHPKDAGKPAFWRDTNLDQLNLKQAVAPN